MTFTTGHGHFLLIFETFYMSRATLYGDIFQFSNTCMFGVCYTVSFAVINASGRRTLSVEHRLSQLSLLC